MPGSQPKVIIGLYVSEKKLNQNKWLSQLLSPDDNEVCEALNCRVVKLDAFSQYRVDVIVQKVIPSQQNLWNSLRALQPDAKVVDELSASDTLSNRILMIEMLQSACVDIQCFKSAAYQLQRDAKLDEKQAYIVKSVQACHSEESHQMIYLPPGCQFLDAQSTQTCIIQPVQCSGFIVKVYVIGRSIHYEYRPGIKINLQPSGAIVFNSQQVPKKFDSLPDRLFETSADILSPNSSIQWFESEPVQEQLRNLVSKISSATKLTLFGMDLVLEKDKATIIDANYFPGYGNSFPDIQRVFLRSCIGVD